MDSSVNATSPSPPPQGSDAVPSPGYKLLAWEGVGLFVPQHWEFGRRGGDARRGFLRIDDETRIVAQLRWWPASRPIAFNRLVDQHARLIGGRHRTQRPPFRPVTGLVLPAATPGDRTGVFTSVPEAAAAGGDGELLIIQQRMAAGRMLVVRVLIAGGQPSPERLRHMLPGLRLQPLQGPRDWAAHDFALRTPPGYSLRQAVLNTGIAYLRFARGRRRIGLRRFSAADAVMGTPHPTLETLEQWCRRVYANAFYDLRYRVEPLRDPAGRPGLRLTGKQRLLAPIEIKWLIPKHRQTPRRIDVIWDAAANKIYCVELVRPSAALEPDVTALEGSLRMTLEPERALELAPTGAAAPADPRARALDARVRWREPVQAARDAQDLVVLTYTVQRPQRLRLLRAIGGLGSGPRTTVKTLALDMIGTQVWDACAAGPRVRDLVDTVRTRFRISHREAELSVSEFVRALGARGLLNVELG